MDPRLGSFDGPGARPILGGDPGPSRSAYDAGAYSQPVSPALPYGAPGPGSGDAGAGAGAMAAAAAADRKRVGGKANVSSACGPCKRAHLACDIARPCKRCVNMGKPELCEDVPHKKRGRPKVTKPATLSTPAEPPYARQRVKGPATYDTPYSTSAGGSPPFTANSAFSGSGFISRPPSPPRSAPDTFAAPWAAVPAPPAALAPLPPASTPLPPAPTLGGSAAVAAAAPAAAPAADLFTLFCTTELKILRASPTCHALTGYYAHEFANLSLADWVHPSDRHLVDAERARLVAVPYLSTQLHSHRETHAAVMACSERELLSPALGMKEPYPNQNVRILRADNGFSLFNVRLHLGGGLGGSLWAPETLGKIYLVVSCLLISERDVPSDAAAARRPVPAVSNSGNGGGFAAPAPHPPVLPPNHALPSFSSIAAGVDGQHSHAQQQAYYPAQTPARAQPYAYPRAVPAAHAPRRSQSPQGAAAAAAAPRQGPAAAYSSAPPAYGPPLGQGAQAYAYPDSPARAYDGRRGGEADDYARRAPPSSAADPMRRAWEL
ncbi:hypothetical protein Q5752_006916 [Cryptotrichosporon argae]